MPSFCFDFRSLAWGKRHNVGSATSPEPEPASWAHTNITSTVFSWEAGAGVVDDGSGKVLELHDQQSGAALAFTQPNAADRPTIGPNGGADWGPYVANKTTNLVTPNTGVMDVWAVAIVWQHPNGTDTLWPGFLDFVGGATISERLTTNSGTNNFWNLFPSQRVYKDGVETTSWLPFSRGFFFYETTNPNAPIPLNVFGNGRGANLDRGIIGEVLAIYAFGGPTGSGVVLPSSEEVSALHAHTEALFGPFG